MFEQNNEEQGKEKVSGSNTDDKNNQVNKLTSQFRRLSSICDEQQQHNVSSAPRYGYY